MGLVLAAGHFGDAELGEVGGPILDVEEGEVLPVKMVALGVKFGLGEEGCAEVDAVGSADQLPVDPDFDGVGVAGLMEGRVCLDDRFGDPHSGRAFGIPPGAISHDLDEGLVEGDLEAGLGERSRETAGEVECVEREDGAAGWVVPGEERSAGIAHGKDALAVASEDFRGVEPVGSANDVHSFDCMGDGVLHSSQRIRGSTRNRFRSDENPVGRFV